MAAAARARAAESREAERRTGRARGRGRSTCEGGREQPETRDRQRDGEPAGHDRAASPRRCTSAASSADPTGRRPLHERQRGEREREDVEHPAADPDEETGEPAHGSRRAGAATIGRAEGERWQLRAAPCCTSQPQLRANAEPSASTRPGGELTRVALERQVRLGRERGDPDPGQVEPPLVDDEAPLPAREELAVEGEQVVELEMALQRQQRAALHGLQAVQLGFGCEQRGERREVQRDVLEAGAARPGDRRADQPLVEAVRVSRRRGIDESDNERGRAARVRSAGSPTRVLGIETDHEERIDRRPGRTAHRAPSRIRAPAASPRQLARDRLEIVRAARYRSRSGGARGGEARFSSR